MSTLILMAQASAPGVSPDDMPVGVMVVMIVTAVMAVPVTAIIVGVKYATKERELQHIERMKALEKGIVLEDVDEERRFRKGIMRLATAIGVVVPICAVGAATGAVTAMMPVASLTVFLIWTGAAAVGVAGVSGGAWLAQGAIARLRPGDRRDRPATSPYARTYDAPEATLAH